MSLDFFSEATAKIRKYQKKYPYRRVKAALKLAIWSLGKAIFSPIKIRSRNTARTNKNITTVAFEIYGGIGDALIAANYIWHFKKFVKDPTLQIDVFAQKRMKFVSSIFRERTYINKIHIKNLDEHKNEYDVCIALARIPQILHVNKTRTCKFNKEFGQILNVILKFQSDNSNLISASPFADGRTNMLSILNGQIRLQQPDLTGLLQIDHNYKAEIFINLDETVCFNKFNLKNIKFITISRECGNSNDGESTKMWPHEYYIKLVAMIKENFPNYKIVQLGTSLNKSKIITGADVCLIGKTSLEETKVLLKYATLHIDSEGGLIHLRHALNAGPSVVMFGPTDMNLYGYPQNINIKANNVCAHPCEWITDNWSKRCVKTEAPHACMKKLTPEMVMHKIKQYFTQKLL